MQTSSASARVKAGGSCAAALGRADFSNLERWLDSEASQQFGLSGIEREVELRARPMLLHLLQAHIDTRGTGDQGPAVWASMPDAGMILYTRRRLHTRSLITVFGTVSVTRVGYSKPGELSLHPLDADLQLPARSYSYEIQRRLTKAAVQGPFDEALAILADTTGIRVPKRSAEQIVLDASVDFESFYAQRAGSAAEAEALILVAAIDSKGIPMVKPDPAARSVRMRKGEKRQKKRMSTVAAVFSQVAEPRTPEEVVSRLFTPSEPVCRQRRTARPVRKRVWASLLSPKGEFIEGVREEMLRRDPQRSKTWVIVTDGERGLQRRVCERFQDVTLVLDLLHVLEKLWAAAYALHPEGSIEAETFVSVRALRILRGQVSQVVKGLRQTVTKRNLQGLSQKTLVTVANYFYRNRSRMRYDRYLANGWPIASGSVEGACKNLIKDRMERSGMRWTPPMAEAMLRLRAAYLSGDFEEYWDYHVQQEQLRLYSTDLSPVVAK